MSDSKTMFFLENKKVLERTFSKDFIEKMKNRLLTSYHKYGDLKTTKNDPRVVRDELKNAEERIKIYKKTGNTEYLVDAANFLMFEYMEMTGAFLGTDSNENSKIIWD